MSKEFISNSAKEADCIDALKNVSLQAYSGELLMIVGPSGCGKTTLLSIIAGTLIFDKGEIDLFGMPLHQLSQKEVTQFPMPAYRVYFSTLSFNSYLNLSRKCFYSSAFK